MPPATVRGAPLTRAARFGHDAAGTGVTRVLSAVQTTHPRDAELKKQHNALRKTAYVHGVNLLEKRLDQLAHMDWADPDAERLGKHLYNYRDKLTTFLHKPEVDGTDDATERALRPAVVMRTITSGSRSEQAAVPAAER